MFEHHVHAAFAGEPADFGGDLFTVVVEDEVGAEFLAARHLLLAARGGDDAAVEPLRELDGGHADATRTGEHQHVLARLQSGPRHQHMPGSDEHQRRGGGVLIVE